MGTLHIPDGAQTTSSAQDLEQMYGDSFRHLRLEHPSAYELCKALRQREQPLCIANKTAEVWLKTYARQCELQCTENAGHLETLYGERIRSDAPPDLTADALQRWLLKEHAVSVRTRICQTFLTRTWSSSGRTLTPDALEEAAGERLRLQEYADRFTADAIADGLATALAESQPPPQVSALILRQWFTKLHPDSGALSYDTAEALEEALGDVLRSIYQGMGGPGTAVDARQASYSSSGITSGLPHVAPEVCPASSLVVIRCSAPWKAQSGRCGRSALSQAPYD